MLTPIQISRAKHQKLIGQKAEVLQVVNSFALIQTDNQKLILKIHPESTPLKQNDQVTIVPIKNSVSPKGVIHYYLAVTK